MLFKHIFFEMTVFLKLVLKNGCFLKSMLFVRAYFWEENKDWKAGYILIKFVFWFADGCSKQKGFDKNQIKCLTKIIIKI